MNRLTYLAVNGQSKTAEPVLDGYDIPFDPEVYLLHLRAGMELLSQPESPKPHVEAEPKDKPAGYWDRSGREFF